MKFTSAALSALLSASAFAYPGMSGELDDFHKRMASTKDLAKRQGPVIASPAAIAASSNQALKNCLSRATSCEDLTPKTYVNPGPLGSSLCAADTCCAWDWVVKDLMALFLGADGQCTEDARTAIRLGFHDAGAWSKTSGIGGADGSVLLSPDELNRAENDGLQDIIGELRQILLKFAPFGVTASDLVQFSANVATVACPLGPRVLTYVGRNSDSVNSPDGLLPDVHSDSTTLLKLFNDKTISATDLAALVGAHSTSTQSVVDSSRIGAPQDSTPGVWDVKFYAETIDPNAPCDVFKFPSDVNLANDPACSGSFQFFGGASPNAQTAWNDGYARAYVRLSLLGVTTDNINGLVDCTKVLPSQVTSFVITQADNSTCSSSSSSSISSLSSSTSSSLSSSTSSKSSVTSSSTSASTTSSFSTLSLSTISKNGTFSFSATSSKPTTASTSSAKYYDPSSSSSKYYDPSSSSSAVWTTSTIYSTKTYTVTKSGKITYSYATTPVSTTVCPVDPTKKATTTSSFVKPSYTPRPGPKKTETIAKGYFGPTYTYKIIPVPTDPIKSIPYSYTFGPSTTVRPKVTTTFKLTYPACPTTTVYTTVTKWV